MHLQVSDLQRSIEYYSGVLGLRVLSGSSGSAELGAYGDETPIVMLHERPGARPVPRRGLLGLYHFAILLPDASGARPVCAAPRHTRRVRGQRGPCRQ